MNDKEIIRSPWRWRQCVASKHCCQPTILHDMWSLNAIKSLLKILPTNCVSSCHFLTEKRVQISGHLLAKVAFQICLCYTVYSRITRDRLCFSNRSEVLSEPFIKRYFLFIALKGDVFNRLIDDVVSLTSATSFVLWRNKTCGYPCDVARSVTILARDPSYSLQDSIYRR